jgi:HAD superfamily hydrolase (TIGR01509 family)
MLAAVVFDFDGIIVDSEPLHYEALVEVIRPMGIELTYDEYLARYIGFDDRDCFRTALWESTGIKPPAGTAQLDELIHRKMLAFEKVVERGVTAMPGAVQLIHELAGSMPLAIASGASRADIDLICRSLNITDCFAVVASADDVNRSKPHPEVYRLAVEQLAERYPQSAITPGRCLAIEDTDQGLASAKAAGLMTLGVATMLEAGRLAQADRVIPSLRNVTANDLQQWWGGEVQGSRFKVQD